MKLQKMQFSLTTRDSAKLFTGSKYCFCGEGPEGKDESIKEQVIKGEFELVFISPRAESMLRVLKLGLSAGVETRCLKRVA